MIGFEIKRNHISYDRENLAKAGVFRWVTNIHEHKDITIPLIIHLLFTESIQNTTPNLSKS